LKSGNETQIRNHWGWELASSRELLDRFSDLDCGESIYEKKLEYAQLATA
jgi:hypothetical protein